MLYRYKPIECVKCHIHPCPVLSNYPLSSRVEMPGNREETHHHYDKFGPIWRSSRSENLIFKLSIELTRQSQQPSKAGDVNLSNYTLIRTPFLRSFSLQIRQFKVVLFQFKSTIECCYLIWSEISHFPSDRKYCVHLTRADLDTWSELRAAPVRRDVTNPAFDRHKELSIFHFDQIDFKYAW